MLCQLDMICVKGLVQGMLNMNKPVWRELTCAGHTWLLAEPVLFLILLLFVVVIIIIMFIIIFIVIIITTIMYFAFIITLLSEHKQAQGTVHSVVACVCSPSVCPRPCPVLQESPHCQCACPPPP
jgi:hypothetical protein